MTYLNQFHKEAVERKLRKIAESMKSPMNSIDAANYMRRNLEFQCKEDAHEHSCSSSFFIRVHHQCKRTSLREYASGQS